MRGWMEDRKGYIPPVPLGDVMRGVSAGQVIESNHPDFKPGDFVCPRRSSRSPAGGGGGDRVSKSLVTDAPRRFFSFDASWKLPGTIALSMVLLALLGVGLTSLNAPLARKYWMTLIPVYGALCTLTAWRRSQQAGASGGALVLRQVLHWLAIGGAVLIDFMIRGAGAEASQTAGFNALLLLALGCLLAGVHLDWSFGLVGLLLALTLVCAVKAEQYLWLLFLAGLVVIGVLLAAWRATGREGRRSPAAP